MDVLVRRIGHIQVLAASGTLLAATVLVQSFTNDLSVWIITRILAGLSMSAFYVVIESWMLDHSEGGNRGSILSLYMLVLSGGYMFGQQFIPYTTLNPNKGYVIAALLFSLCVIPIALSTKKLTPPAHENPLKITKIFQVAPFGTLSNLASGIFISSLFSFLAIVATRYNVDGSRLVTYMVLGGLLAQWPIGHLSDYLDRRKVLLCITLILFFPSLILIFYTPAHTWITLTLAGVIGAGAFTLYPISLTQVTDHLSRAHFASAAATIVLVYGVGCIFGPIFTSLTIQWIGEVGLFALLSLFAALLAAAGLYTLFKRPPLPKEKKGDFHLFPRTTSTAYELKKTTLPEENNQDHDNTTD